MNNNITKNLYVSSDYRWKVFERPSVTSKMFSKTIKKLSAAVKLNYAKSKIKSLNTKKWHWRVTDMGELADVTKRNFKPEPQILKISKTEYVKGRWIEGKFHARSDIMQFKENDKRNERSLRRIFKSLRQTLTANFSEENDKKLFITLTYRENMTDKEKIFNDFKAFYKRLKRAYSDHKFSYVVVIEPQARGAWHAHLCLKSDKSLFIPHAEMERIWRHGATRTERLSGIDNIGAYFIAYVSNIPIDEEFINKHEVTPDDIIERGPEKKKYLKGERLRHYPDYMQIWRHSRDIEVPKSEPINEKEVQSQLNPAHLTHTYEITSEGNTLAIINTQHRKKKPTQNLTKP